MLTPAALAKHPPTSRTIAVPTVRQAKVTRDQAQVPNLKTAAVTGADVPNAHPPSRLRTSRSPTNDDAPILSSEGQVAMATVAPNRADGSASAQAAERPHSQHICPSCGSFNPTKQLMRGECGRCHSSLPRYVRSQRGPSAYVNHWPAISVLLGLAVLVVVGGVWWASARQDDQKSSDGALQTCSSVRACQRQCHLSTNFGTCAKECIDAAGEMVQQSLHALNHCVNTKCTADDLGDPRGLVDEAAFQKRYQECALRRCAAEVEQCGIQSYDL